jgi:hypothetical protein
MASDEGEVHTYAITRDAEMRQCRTHICKQLNRRSQARGSVLAVGSVSPSSRSMSGAIRNISSWVRR